MNFNSNFNSILIYNIIEFNLYNKSLVYCSILYKIMKEYSWNNYNEIEGFLIIKESLINIKLLKIKYKIKNTINKLNKKAYKNN
jgi:hypothetical protein